jgi:hypothetical protein
MAETTKPGRMNRFNPIIEEDCVDTAPQREHHIG